MRKGKQKAVLWFLMGMLFVAGLSWKGVTAQAAVDSITLTKISRPNQIAEYEKQDIGIICQGTRETVYYTFTLTERSWVLLDLCSQWAWSFEDPGVSLYYNASRTKKVSRELGYSSGSNSYLNGYFLDPGQYYIVQYGYDTMYGFVLPASEAMTLGSSLSSDKTTATITVSSPIPAYRVFWSKEYRSAEDISSSKWENESLENSIDVEDNGTYSVQIIPITDEWKGYKLHLSIDISGVVKCEHDFSAYDVDEEGHIAKCKKCGKVETGEKIEHSYDDGKVTLEPTCITEGEKTYTCTVCGYTEVETIDTGAHNYENKITPATPAANGAVTPTCTVCGATGSGSVIWRPTSFVLSAKAYTYDGKVKKPTVTIRDDYGRALGSESYKLKYVGGCKNVGKYTVKVVFAGNYSGTKSLTFIINPKGTSISKVTAEKKSLKIVLKKQTGQTSGYEVQASTDKNFKRNVKKAAMKNSKISTTIKNLKSGAKYYVRVRTYKSVGSKKFYSEWKTYPKVVTIE